MIIVVSPAKSLDYQRPLPACDPTAPRFAEEALAFARACSRLSRKRLAEFMGISPALAGFDADGYRHDPEASTPERLRFVRA